MDYFDMAESARKIARYQHQAPLPRAPLVDLRHASDAQAPTPEERNRANLEAYRVRRARCGCDADALELATKTLDGIQARAWWFPPVISTGSVP